MKFPSLNTGPLAETFNSIPAIAAGNAWLEYLNDGYQRWVLYFDILRQRGDQQAASQS
jgi:hypothetical protein